MTRVGEVAQAGDRFHNRSSVAVRAILILLVVAPAATADDAHSMSCAADVSKARFELDESRDEERLAPIRFEADAAIHDLLEPLWKAKSTERLRYLAAKRARDVSRVGVARAVIARKRAEARLSLLTIECYSGDEGASDALASYDALECDLMKKDKEIAAIDRAYRSEVLESTSQLRSQELTTAQELIQARFGMQSAESLLRSYSKRLRECHGRVQKGG